MARPGERIQDIAHLGFVELLTPKPVKTLWYFHELLGMEVAHEEGASCYLRGYGDHATSTLKITAAQSAGVGCIAWRAASPEALERRVKEIEAKGLGDGWSNGDFGRGRSYRFHDPDGHRMEIYYEEERYVAPPPLRSTLKNLPMKFAGRGANVRRMDHLALFCKSVPENRRFAEETLGFRLSEQVIFNQGRDEIGAWLSPSPVHHQVAYVADAYGAHGRLHHLSFWVDSRDDVMRAADVLIENGIFIEAGPSKHNNSQGFYLYSYEPGGNRIEVYSGSYLIFAPDWQTVTWNEAERGTGVYWGASLPESFATYGTPPVRAAAKSAPVIDPM
ncbi:MAG: VOC family protein [Rhodospirillaceae bacterium]|nr:VOC family protein [Rhodospirillaceae bacterium]